MDTNLLRMLEEIIFTQLCRDFKAKSLYSKSLVSQPHLVIKTIIISRQQQDVQFYSLIVDSFYQTVETVIDLHRTGNLAVGIYECPDKDKCLFH